MSRRGSINSRWPTVPIRYVARLGTGHTPSRQHPEYWENCTIPWVTLADVGQLQGLEQPTSFRKTSEMISPLGVANSSAVRHPARNGDPVSDGVGRVLGHSWHRHGDEPGFRDLDVRSASSIAKYLSTLCALWRPDLRAWPWVTHKTIYMPDIAELRVPLPPVDEQHRIADFLDAETARIDELIAFDPASDGPLG